MPNPIPTNKPGVEPKRPPKAINVTGLCKLSSTVPNYINVSWTVEVGRGFTISVYFVEKLSSQDLLHKLKSKGKYTFYYLKLDILLHLISRWKYHESKAIINIKMLRNIYLFIRRLHPPSFHFCSYTYCSY